MTDPRHALLLASAGTGKTYRLTSHLLGLLFRGADPARILPTTFTRKAAREILERVLQRLVEAIEEPAKRAELARDVGLPLEERRCRALLVELARRLDRFQVATLDAFFVRLGHLFALDLGLPPGWTIADPLEEERQTHDAIGRVLAEGDREEVLELLRGLRREGGARSLRRALQGVVEDARATFLDSAPGAWERVVPPPEVEPEELAVAVRNLHAFEVPRTGAGTPNKLWENAVVGLRAAVDAEDWKAVLDSSLVKKVREGEERFARAVIPDEFLALLEPLLEQAAHGTLAEVARRNRATVALLGRYEAALRDVKRERASYGFLDLPLALAPGGPGAEGRLDERELDLQFRLDARIDHLLLDEFQDTSPIQWRILERLASEVLGEGDGERTFFCVGDVKQSIYGWREAEPRLLSEMHARYPVLETETMAKSYRSSAVVLDTVDRVFDQVHEAAALAKREPWLVAARRWRAGYERHDAARDLPGAALLLEARARGEDEPKWEPVLELLVQRVETLVAEARVAGSPSATIGVLLRSNKPLPGILSRLLARGIRASGEGGNELVDSQAVLHLISLLHLVDHPGDRAAAFHVAQSPLAGALRDLDPGRSAAPEALARRVRARLVRDGYGPFCAALAPAVERADAYGAWDRRRFRQLVDLAYAHDRGAGLRTDDFVDVLRRTRVEDPDASQVKVMTIHASKGLEFDAVLLPELDAGLHPRHPGVVALRPDPTGGFEAASAHPGRRIAAFDRLLTELVEDYEGRVIEESLSVLYVAMTRAARRLEMIVQRPARKRNSEDGSAATYAGILRDALGAGEPDESGVLWRHPDGSDEWAPEGHAEAASDATRPPEPPPGLGLAPRRGPRALVHRSPSAEEGGGARVRGRALLRRADDALEHGSLLHRWFEEVEWLEDFARDDDELLALAAGLEPDEARRRAELAEFRAALARPAVRDSLSRGASGGGLFDAQEREVWRERRFSLVLPDDEGSEVCWSGAIDRVVVERDASGAATAAEVLDFKTDRVRGDELDARVEFYRPQLEGYRRVVARITGLPERAVRATLLFVQPGKRVEWSSGAPLRRGHRTTTPARECSASAPRRVRRRRRSSGPGAR